MSRTATTCSSGSPSESGSFLRHIGNLAASTLVSRLLGLLRDIAMTAILGGGALMSAWVQAFGWASMFRQVFGEGALGQALVPILTRTLKDSGTDAARRQFSTLFIYLTLLLTVFTILFSLPLFLLAQAGFFTSPIWRTAALLTPIVMPYTIFICAVGIMTSCMNMMREFFLPSLTAIIQNLIVICTLFFLCPLFAPGMDKVRVLAFSVLAAGLFEFLFMLYLLKRKKLQLTFTSAVWKDFATLKEIFTVALPGILASGAHIISTQIDRLISGNIPRFAGEIGNYATAALYNSDRLVLLPVGIFAFAFGTVALTDMSRSAVDGDYEKFKRTLFFSMRNLLFLTVPVTAFLFVFGEETIRVLFMRGAFNQTALEQTVFALQFYVFGIPAFALLKVTSSAFTARKDMNTPFYTGLAAIVCNIILNLTLMVPLRQGGIALATVVSSFLNNALLLYMLNRAVPFAVNWKGTAVYLLKLLSATLLPLIPAVYASGLIGNIYCKLGMAAAVYGIVFLICAGILRMNEINILKRITRR